MLPLLLSSLFVPTFTPRTPGSVGSLLTRTPPPADLQRYFSAVHRAAAQLGNCRTLCFHLFFYFTREGLAEKR